MNGIYQDGIDGEWIYRQIMLKHNTDRIGLIPVELHIHVQRPGSFFHQSLDTDGFLVIHSTLNMISYN